MTLVLGAVAFMSLAISIFAHICLAKKLKKQPKAATGMPAISVLKPLRGVDEGLRQNLVALCQNDYPTFEVLFCAADAHDPALAVAREVQAAFPSRRISILADDGRTGLNPKIRLLEQMLTRAEHDWLLVSDSDVRPDRDYLRSLMAAQAESGAGLVHSLLVARGGRGLGSRLQKLQLNGWVASSVALADAGLHPAVVGKSMLLRRADLASIGGFAAVQDVLAEDYVLGLRFHAAGHGIALSPHLVPVIGRIMGAGQYLERQLRWAQLRRRTTGALFLGEFFIQPLPFFLAFACLGQIEHWLMAALGMGTKWIFDAVAYLRLDRDDDWPAVFLLPFKDAISPFVWLVAAFRTRVSWRGQPLRLGRGSQLVPLTGRPLFTTSYYRA